MKKRRFFGKDFEEKQSNKVLELDDLKLLLRDYLKVWKKEEIEKEFKKWFSEEFDEG